MVALSAMFLNSCVNDDDFDVPPLPGANGEEILSLGGSSPVFLTCFQEDFEAYTVGTNTFAGYENVTVAGTSEIWEVNEFNDNNYLLMSSFSSGEDNEVYFVVPVNFDAADAFSFKTQDRFNNGDVLSVFLVTNYTIPANINEATLTDITSSFNIASGTTGSASQPFVESGAYDLTALTGNGFIAFQYSGSDITGVTTNMHIDDIVIVDNDDASCDLDAGSGAGGGGTTGGGGSAAMAQSCDLEDFESFAEFDEVFDAYENVGLAGDRLWRVDEFGGNQYLQASAFNGSPSQDQWFLYNIDFDTADVLSFKTKDGFNNGDPLTVLWSTDHVVGNNVLDATWTDISSSFTLATGTTSGFADVFTDSGEFDLSAISGQGFVAFRYQGGSGGITTTMQVDDITVVDNDDASCDFGGGGGGTAMTCSEDDFESYAEFDTDLAGYQSVATGDAAWTVREFSANKFIQMSAFSTGGAQDSWFIVGVDFDAAQGVSFETKDGFNNGDALTVLYSTDYDEAGDPSTASWTDITSNFTLATGTSSGFADTFTPSGEFDLSGVSGNGYMAFRYQGDVAGVTTTFQLDNLVFTSADGMDCTFDITGSGGGGGGGGGTADSDIIITGVIDGPLSGGTPKAIELYVVADVADLSIYNVSSANNGGGSDGPEFSLSGAASAGDFLYVTTDNAQFNAFFGFDATFVDGPSAGINGDDAIELFKNDVVVDTFGDINVDGNGEAWEYLDGWAYRNNGTGPEGMTFTVTNWSYSGPNALDGETTNAGAATPFPIGTYTP